MSTVTKSRTISSVVDVRAALSNSTCARPWSTQIGISWTKIRIALRVAMEDSGASLTGTPRLFLGACSGTSNPWDNGSGTTTHAVGAISTPATWTRVTGPPVVYGGLNIQACKRVGTTQTIGGSDLNAAAGTFFGADPANGQRYLFFLDITKGSPNFTLQLFSKNSNGTADVSKETFESQAEILACSLTAHAFGSSQSLAVDEATNGNLNGVNFGWDRTTPKFEICDCLVVRFS
jgi:hypothetical protein